MIKQLLCLCAVLVVVVYAKPAEPQNSVAERPFAHRKPGARNCPDNETGRLTIFTGRSCDGAKTTFACDGNCVYVTEGKLNSVRPSDFADNKVVSVDFFDDESCAGSLLGTGDYNEEKCYQTKYFKNVQSFACYIDNETTQPTLRPPPSK